MAGLCPPADPEYLSGLRAGSVDIVRGSGNRSAGYVLHRIACRDALGQGGGREGGVGWLAFVVWVQGALGVGPMAWAMRGHAGHGHCCLCR